MGVRVQQKDITGSADAPVVVVVLADTTLAGRNVAEAIRKITIPFVDKDDMKAKLKVEVQDFIADMATLRQAAKALKEGLDELIVDGTLEDNVLGINP